MRTKFAVAPTVHGDIIFFTPRVRVCTDEICRQNAGILALEARFVAIIDDTADRKRATDINFRDFVRCERVRKYDVVEDVRKVHLDPPLRLFTRDVLSAGDDVHFVQLPAKILHRGLCRLNGLEEEKFRTLVKGFNHVL